MVLPPSLRIGPATVLAPLGCASAGENSAFSYLWHCLGWVSQSRLGGVFRHEKRRMESAARTMTAGYEGEGAKGTRWLEAGTRRS